MQESHPAHTITQTLTDLFPQVPSNIFLAQLRPSVYLPVCMASWGIVSTCTGAVQSAAGLYAARFFLGFVEACFYPGCIFLLSSWYRRSELSLRCAILYGGSQVGSAFSGLIAAGITEGLDGALGLRAWRWIFVSCFLTQRGVDL